MFKTNQSSLAAVLNAALAVAAVAAEVNRNDREPVPTLNRLPREEKAVRLWDLSYDDRRAVKAGVSTIREQLRQLQMGLGYREWLAQGNRAGLFGSPSRWVLETEEKYRKLCDTCKAFFDQIPDRMFPAVKEAFEERYMEFVDANDSVLSHRVKIGDKMDFNNRTFDVYVRLASPLGRQHSDLPDYLIHQL